MRITSLLLGVSIRNDIARRVLRRLRCAVRRIGVRGFRDGSGSVDYFLHIAFKICDIGSIRRDRSGIGRPDIRARLRLLFVRQRLRREVHRARVVCASCLRRVPDGHPRVGTRLFGIGRFDVVSGGVSLCRRRISRRICRSSSVCICRFARRSDRHIRICPGLFGIGRRDVVPRRILRRFYGGLGTRCVRGIPDRHVRVRPVRLCITGKIHLVYGAHKFIIICLGYPKIFRIVVV